MKYFAYGSNMLEERLKAGTRVPGARFLTSGSVKGYDLRFHKQSDDRSGKCNVIRTGSEGSVVYGIVFEIPVNQLEDLDRAEGVGHGYHQDYSISIQLADGAETKMLAYVADSSAIDDNLIPYEWYHRLVIAGAEQHRLPKYYIECLQAVPFSKDPKPNRPTKLEAEAALKAYYGRKR
jgi:gamma-glutamylcyclotransferase (GGCT)/AIG2-like uncharacterized protein YtfP